MLLPVSLVVAGALVSSLPLYTRLSGSTYPRVANSRLISVSAVGDQRRMHPSYLHIADEFYAVRARRNALLTKLAGDRMIAALDRLGEILGEKSDDADQPEVSVGAHAGYNADQPRVPAGSPDGGQWASQNGSLLGDLPIGSIASSGGRALRNACEAQLERDIFQCRMVGMRSCYDQAYQRYASCLAKQPIPPFNY